MLKTRFASHLNEYMADEDLLDLELEDNDVEKRIKDLSRKVKLTSEERDEKDRLVQERDEQLATVSKERDFYKDFSSNVSRYPNASEYQDAILEKVKTGYTVEDATVAVLAKEGKFTNMPQSELPKDNPAGGSATTNTSGSEKSMSEMSHEEKRAELDKMFGDKPLSQQ